MAARECCYNVYSDKLDHQRASESFWSKYFHVWICEDPFQESQRKTLVFLLSEFLQNLTLTCQALEKVSYTVGRSSDPSPSRGPVVPRLPCVRHPLIMFAFLSTFFCDKVLLTIFLSDLDKMKERKEKEGWFGSKCFFPKKGVGVGSCRDHLLSQRSAIARRKRHWDSPCIRTTYIFLLFEVFWRNYFFYILYTYTL